MTATKPPHPMTAETIQADPARHLAAGKYRIVLIGGSAGAMAVYRQVFPHLPKNFPLPIVVVQHLHPDQSDYHIQSCNCYSTLPVQEAVSREAVRPGRIYFAPANYHLLIEDDYHFSLSIDEKVNFCRPAIDVTFECAAAVYGPGCIGLILSGANNDGAFGLRQIKACGGFAIIQKPETADSDAMPLAASEMVKADCLLGPSEIAAALIEITMQFPMKGK
jgi:two-component system, chemotaxis family, protein-glutamate methylesterase/glutaminase